MRQPIHPFLTPDPDDLDNHYREVLATIAGTVNADSMAANPRLMSDYLALRNKGMVMLLSKPTGKPFQYQLEIVLADKAAQVAKPAPKPIQRIETGDQVTIIGLRPRVGRKGYTWGHWEGLTTNNKSDNTPVTQEHQEALELITHSVDKEYPIVHLYPEDFKAFRRAGYADIPDWNDRARSDATDSDELIDIVFNRTGFDNKGKKQRPVEASFPVEIEVILKPERVNGHWRIAQVVEPEVKWIFVNYAELSAGDVIQNGFEGKYTIVSIGDVYQGTRKGTVEDTDGTRDATFKSTLTYTLVGGELLEAARKDRGMIEWRGSGWVVKEKRAG